MRCDACVIKSSVAGFFLLAWNTKLLWCWPSFLPGRRWRVSASPPLAFWSSYYFGVQIARDFRVKITCASSPNFGCLLFNLKWEINREKQTKQAEINASLSFLMPFDNAQLAKALEQVFPDIDVPQ